MDSKILDWLSEEIPKAPTSQVEEPPRKTYDTKLVAWLDILGIRVKIKDEKNDAQSIISIMSELESYVRSACDDYVKAGVMTYLQIADGFMIVADIDTANELCACLADIQWKILLNLKMLSRGAITAGSVSVVNEGSLIIGPAYVDAYVLESENAIFPRVIIPEIFFQATKDVLKFKHIKTDTDHVNYIDYISYIIEKNRIDSMRLNYILTQEGVCEMINEQYNSAAKKPNFSILQKYGWMKELLFQNKIRMI